MLVMTNYVINGFLFKTSTTYYLLFCPFLSHSHILLTVGTCVGVLLELMMYQRLFSFFASFCKTFYVAPI